MRPIPESHLYQEIHQQPGLIRNLIENTQDSINALAEEILSRGIRTCVHCGSRHQ